MPNVYRADSTQRFSGRVEFYRRYRPGYPQQLISLLKRETNLSPDDSIADIGSGTGILTEMFLKNGNRVYGVEPNREMREAAESHLSGYKNFISVRGSAEATTLPASVVDFVTAAQAFHWFDREKTRREFARILKRTGWVILIWNSRKTGATPFLKAYERLLQKYAIDYRQVNHQNIGDSVLEDFFDSFRKTILPNQQIFDYEALEGRLLSSSYAPLEDHANFQPMIRELQRIFRRHHSNHTVTFQYDTQIYYGRVKTPSPA